MNDSELEKNFDRINRELKQIKRVTRLEFEKIWKLRILLTISSIVLLFLILFTFIFSFVHLGEIKSDLRHHDNQHLKTDDK